MPVTNFPGGLSSFGFPNLGSGQYLGVGNVFFVSSLAGTDAAGRGTDPTKPFKTINYALSKCSAPSASKIGGDFIFVLPGHVESISVDGSAASPGPTGSISVNVAGVTIVGLGEAANRPLIQWTATAGKIEINAANTRFSNLVFDMATQIASVVVGINVNGVKGSRFDNCRFITSTTAQAAVLPVNLAAGWGDTEFSNCSFDSNSGLPFAAATAQIAAAAGDRLRLIGCTMIADASNSLIDGGTAILTNVLIKYGEYTNVNSGHKPVLKGNNSSTGMVRSITTLVIGAGGSQSDVVSGTGFTWVDCLGKNAASGTAGGIIVPGTAGY